MRFGMAAEKNKGQRVIPLTLLMVSLLKLFPDGKQIPLTPDLGGSTRAHNDWYRETLADLLDLLATGKIEPGVAERIPLVEAACAHELLERSR